MGEEPSSHERQQSLQRLRMTLRETGEYLLELQEQLIALRFAMSPADYLSVDKQTAACIQKAGDR